MILLITLSVIVIICLLLYYRQYITFPKYISSEKIALSALITLYNNVSDNIDLITNNIHLLLELKITVIIVDDGSTDNSIKLLQDNINHPDLHFISLKNQGKYKALFSAIELVKSSHILMIDADVKLTQKTIITLQKVDSKFDWVQTGIIHDKPKNLIQSFTFIDQILLQKTAFLTMNSSHAIIGIGACARINKEKYLSLFEKTTIRYGGDMLIIKNLDKNTQLMLSTDYDVNTAYLPSFKRLIQQRKRWALNNKNGSLNIITIIGSIFWLTLLFTFPLSLTSCLIYKSLTPLLILTPILGTFLLFLHRKFSMINLLSFIYYLIFGWLFYIIILILITFGQFENKNTQP